MAKRRLLLISPYFPPANIIGAKRAVNLVHGIQNTKEWEVVVLASKPFKTVNTNQSLPLPDNLKVVYGFESFLRPLVKYLVKLIFTPKDGKERNEERKTRKKSTKKDKAPKKKISYTPFDQYLWDVPGALKSGEKIIKEFKPDVIWVNADPWSGLLVGHILSKRSGIPWVVDMRDPWTIFEKKMQQRPELTRRVIYHYEKLFFESSQNVVFNCESAYDAYSQAYPEITKKFSFIRNAFNRNIFKNGDHTSDSKFVFGYFGSFRSFVSSEKVLEAFTHFVNENKLSPEQVRLIVNGGVDDLFWENMERLNIEDYILVNNEIDVTETLSLLQSWDVLLMMVSPDYKWMIPAKLYDYLVAQRPIISISDNKEVNDIIDKTQSGTAVSFEKTEDIAQVFKKYYLAGRKEKLSNDELIESYGLDEQTRLFLDVLNRTVADQS